MGTYRDKKMKLLLVSPLPPPAGGIQTITDTLVSYLRNYYNAIDFSVYDTAHRLRPATSQNLLIRVITGLGNSAKTFFAVQRYIRKEKPDIVHLSSSSSLALIKDLLIVIFANRMNVPIVMHWHFGRIPELVMKDNWEWKLLKMVIKKSTTSIVLDSASYNALHKNGFRNILLIPNPLPLVVERKMSEMISERQRTGIDHRDHGRIIFVGHIIKEKGAYDLTEACSQIPSVRELVLIGDFENSVHNDLLRIASVRSDGSWLKMTGELSHNQVLDIMCHSSILALPSYTEGFPMVIIEAMAMGCTIIATDVGAIPEMIAISGESACGMCVPVQDVPKLRSVIEALIDDYDKLQSLSKNGIDRIMQNYRTENIIGMYLEAWYKAVYR